MHHEGRRGLSQVGVYLLARGLPGLVAFLAIPVFSRMLEPADYGRYALVLTAATLLNSLVFQWLRLSLVRYLPVFRDDPARLKSTLLGATVVLSAVMGVSFVLAGLFMTGSTWRMVLLSCWVMLTVQAFYELCCEYTRAIIQPWRYMWLQVIRSGVAVTLGVGLVILGWGWWGPVVALTAGMAIAVAYAFPIDWRGAQLALHAPTLKRLGHYGIPVSMTVALAMVIGTSDRFLIAWMIDESAAGLYSVAVDFTTQTLTLVMMVISMAMFPLAVHAWETEGRSAAQAQMRSNASLMLAVGVPCIVGLAVATPAIVHCFLGESFRPAALRIVPMVGLIAFVAALKAFHFDAAFQFTHKTIHQVWIVFFAAIINIALNVVMIPIWKLEGSIVASLIAYLMTMVLTIWYGRRFVSLPIPLVPAVQVLVSAAAMGLVLMPFRNHVSPLALTAQIAGGGAVYGLLLVAMNFIGVRDSLYHRLVTRPERADRTVEQAGVSLQD
jgi:O-antigen/teichoic acid export membrane protein